MTIDRSDTAAYAAANKQTWDASAHLHGTGPAWETLLAQAAQPAFSVFDDCITQTLEHLDLKGKRAVQVGCNNARELLSLASFGAVPALGIDQSAAFLAQGTQLAQAAGLTPRLLEANIYDLPDDLGQFDLVLITIGVLNWMPDLPAFFLVIAGLMAPGAKLVIYETHPMLEMFEPGGPTPFEPVHNYFETAPDIHEGGITYDGSDGGDAPTGYWFSHTMGAILNGCIAAGLCIENLTEHPHSNREVDFDIYADRAAQMPMSFTLVAAN
ncbi:class I SAM-dependent methyltransferase [Ascidiaceihabitans sp.]|uniref:class I SAM-dependent methyltransferase n=1 Tax=Ascidiaceihabitans sp. TaxID=1872644 RepID=UPI003299ED7D